MEALEVCIPNKVDVRSMKLLIGNYEDPNLVKIPYKIHTEFGVKFREMVSDDNACDMVGLGYCYDGMEVYIVHDDTTNKTFGNQLTHVKVYHDAKEAIIDDNGSIETSDFEYFRDSDYDFDDDGDSIYEKYVHADVDNYG